MGLVITPVISDENIEAQNTEFLFLSYISFYSIIYHNYSYIKFIKII